MSLTTKRIVWVNERGQLVVTKPNWNARFVMSSHGAVPAFHFVRHLSGAEYQRFSRQATWAETEQEFLNRIRTKDCGGQGIIIDVVDDLPEPMGEWHQRSAWKLRDGRVVIDLA